MNEPEDEKKRRESDEELLKLLGLPKGDHLYPIQELKARCPECASSDANFQNQFVLKRSVYGDEKPWLKMKGSEDGTSFSTDSRVPIMPGSFYFMTRLACPDCGYWDQMSGGTQVEVEAMLERRKKYLFPPSSASQAPR